MTCYVLFRNGARDPNSRPFQRYKFVVVVVNDAFSMMESLKMLSANTKAR